MRRVLVVFGIVGTVLAAWPDAAQAQSRAVNQSQDACSRLAADLPQVPGGDLAGAASGICLSDTCLAVAAIDSAAAHLAKRLAAITDPTRKADIDAVKASLEKLAVERKLIADKLQSLDPSLGGLPKPGDPAPPDWMARTVAARATCELVSTTIQRQLEASIAARTAADQVKICRDKQDRLADFLKRYYGLVATSKAPLVIERARYGDLYNEDREYHHAEARSLGGKAGRRYLESQRHADIDNRTARAGFRFTSPEDRDVGVDWGRHRHTCDVTWYFRQSCGPRPYSAENATWGGLGYCYVSLAATAGTSLCGYDPSPQGDKQFHVLYSCNGERRQAKFPDKTLRINLLCEQPNVDVSQAEKDYFATPPCKVTLPDVVKMVPAPSPAPAPAPAPAPTPPGNTKKPS